MLNILERNVERPWVELGCRYLLPAAYKWFGILKKELNEGGSDW